ncbi:vegetative incompatibility protein HET-E-1, putative [Rhizoctonia solani AG-3 Rhs1AP]|uniref:Vegetative incompatibility protein HET-E-1, putative n=2 Tax=Rhizoctonia solani AG-3 TaxID=1086053 RepID=X8JI37_9AGAM|nr:vegetative incompatibility protein HET-E-1, putative [Rhizoctonia solani AG-3 Rhs1AP]KEP45823.1 putative vegetative incompatibility protein HET-E-1 [Rhizoctonia solani 123E]
MAQLCFECIRSTDPQFNICQLESSYIPDEQVEDLDLRINRSIPTELFYACRYWAHHLYNANGATTLSSQLKSFLSNRLLLWLEVLNLKKATRLAGKSINIAEIWCKRNGCTSDLIELAHDCWRFSNTFALNPISKSTPHIYISMLPFWPQSSPIGRYYRKRAQGMLQVKGTAMGRHHLAPLAIWSFKGLRSASSSPDGTSIALVLGSQLFVVDAFSGRVAVGPFTGHTHWARPSLLLHFHMMAHTSYLALKMVRFAYGAPRTEKLRLVRYRDTYTRSLVPSIHRMAFGSSLALATRQCVYGIPCLGMFS